MCRGECMYRVDPAAGVRLALHVWSFASLNDLFPGHSWNSDSRTDRHVGADADSKVRAIWLTHAPVSRVRIELPGLSDVTAVCWAE